MFGHSPMITLHEVSLNSVKVPSPSVIGSDIFICARSLHGNAMLLNVPVAWCVVTICLVHTNEHVAFTF